MTDLLVGWDDLCALSAACDALVGSGRGDLLQFFHFGLQLADLNLELLTLNDFLLVQFKYREILLPLTLQ